MVKTHHLNALIYIYTYKSVYMYNSTIRVRSKERERDLVLEKVPPSLLLCFFVYYNIHVILYISREEEGSETVRAWVALYIINYINAA